MSVIKFKLSNANSKTQQRLFNKGAVYISITEPRAFTTVCILNCSVSVDYLKQKRTALTMKWCENVPYCSRSIV